MHELNTKYENELIAPLQIGLKYSFNIKVCALKDTNANVH